MAIGEIPPWLDVRPAQFIQAMSEGAQAGARERELAQRAFLESARLSAAASNQAAELALAKQKLDQQAMLSQQELQMKRELAQQQTDRMMQQAEMQHAYRQASLGLQNARLQDAASIARQKQEAAALEFADVSGVAQDVSKGMSVMDAISRHPRIPASMASSLSRTYEAGREMTPKVIDVDGIQMYQRSPRQWSLAPLTGDLAADKMVLEAQIRAEVANQAKQSEPEDIAASEQKIRGYRDRLAQVLSRKRGGTGSATAGAVPEFTVPWGEVPVPTMSVAPVPGVPSTAAAPAGAAAAPTTATAAPNPYIPGRRYGNLRYKGGDPNLESSWEPAQ